MAVMKKNHFYSALIQELEKIYARLVLTVLHSRMDRYQKQARQGLRPHAHDIKTPLLACINTLAANAQNSSGALPATDQLPPPSRSANPPLLDNTAGVELPGVNKEHVGELSKYFKARINGSELHPGIETRLEQSTWEHILAALRYAKQGDKPSARMHANIASSACKELAHYLREEEYLGFVAEIEQQLKALQHDTQIAT